MNKLQSSKKKYFSAFFLKIFNAFKGLYIILKEEIFLVWIFTIIGISYIFAGILYSKMSYIEWIVIILIGTFLITIEIINTAIENIVDLIHFKYGFTAKKVKNIASAASLVMNLGSIVSFCVLFIPKLIN